MKRWTNEEHNYLIELKQNKYTWKEVAERMTQKFGEEYNAEQCRGRWRNNRHKIVNEVDPREKYPTKITRHSDGSVDIDQLIEISKTQLKDDAYILEAHGYNPDKWEITSHQFSMWNHHNKQDGTKTLYASKIKVKPKEFKFDEDSIIKAIKRLPSIHIPKRSIKIPKDRPYINIPLFDMHFGIADYKYYKTLQERILYYLEQPRKDVLFIIGQDLFHNDDFRGRTTSGREIERVDMEKAFEDAFRFYKPLLDQAVKTSENVHVYYSIGNHDEFSGWSFVKYLEGQYSQIIFDTRFKERKVHMLGTNFIGMNHSDKKKMKKLPENFATEFPREWSMATTREVFVGHEHREEVLIVNDDGGLVMRRMPTGNKTDDWHDQMGYTTAHKRFQILEYSEHEVRDIHYV